MSGSKAAPGWYADPEMVDTQRYWDGEQWTEQRAPATAQALKGMSSRTVAWGILRALAAIVLIVMLVELFGGA